MPHDLPRKKKHDRLSLRHVDSLNAVFRSAEGSPVGDSPWQQYIFLVTSSEGEYLRKGNVRYYDHSVGEWTEHSKEWYLDGGASESDLSVGDLTAAYWDGQRGTFVAIVCPTVGISCLIWQDTFDRESSDDVGDDWTEVEGIWQIVDGKLKTGWISEESSSSISTSSSSSSSSSSSQSSASSRSV